MRKKFFWVVACAGTTFLLQSCIISNTRTSGHVPPGQEKKITGSQSAKPYAPGQQKKKH
jgi:hypothetical protein